ncbi:UNVERIFIED_CONTAM: hypothetical protein LK11_00535 [Mumia flava]
MCKRECLEQRDEIAVRFDAVCLTRFDQRIQVGGGIRASDTVGGAKASATIYSLVLTCRACDVEPYDYLLHVLTELP